MVKKDGFVLADYAHKVAPSQQIVMLCGMYSRQA
jgi:hypothetical protein